MSAKGINQVAAIFTLMQQTRIDLIGKASQKNVVATKSGHEDLRLAQLLEIGKEAMQEMFNKIVSESDSVY